VISDGSYNCASSWNPTRALQRRDLMRRLVRVRFVAGQRFELIGSVFHEAARILDIKTDPITQCHGRVRKRLETEDVIIVLMAPVLLPRCQGFKFVTKLRNVTIAGTVR
jgi:hypothetical protein